MQEESLCPSCSTNIASTDIFDHVERCLIGTRPAGSLYDISCGDCSFKTCGMTGTAIINHLSCTGHRISKISLRWEYFMEKELQRVKEIVKTGLEMLPDRKRVPAEHGETSFPGTQPTLMIQKVKEETTPAENELKRKLQEIRQPKAKKGIRAKVSRNSTETTNPSSTEGPGKRVGFADTIPSIPEMAITVERYSEETGLTSTQDEQLQSTFPPHNEMMKFEDERSEYQFSMNSNMTPGIEGIPEQDSLSAENFFNDASADFSQEGAASHFMDLSQSSEYQDELESGSANRQEDQKPFIPELVRCHLCETDLTSRRTRSHTELYLLSHFTCHHSVVNIFRCSACTSEFQTLNRWKSHAEKSPCLGERISLKTEEMVVYFREQLHRCFPHWDFEFALRYSPYLGGVEKRMKPKISLTGRSTEAKKGDCHLCDRSGTKDFHHRVSHALGHADLKLFACPKCAALYRNPSGIKWHAKSAQDPGCDGTYETKETDEDIMKIRNTLKEAFPEFDWDKELEGDRKFYGLNLKI